VLAPPGLRVAGDATLLRAAVDNLLANAVAYNVDGGWARAALRSGGGDVELLVANGGPSVDPDTVDGLFEPFVRADASRSRRAGGAGLGLAIVRAVALAHGGRVTATARPEGGLELRLALPAIRCPTSPAGAAT